MNLFSIFKKKPAHSYRVIIITNMGGITLDCSLHDFLETHIQSDSHYIFKGEGADLVIKKVSK